MNEVTKKQAARQAPVPPPAYIREMVEEISSPKVEPGEKRDNLMIEFAQSDAWKEVKRYIENNLRELAGKLRKVSEGSGSLEEVGYKYLVADAVNQFSSGLISFVETPLKLKRAEGARGQ